MMRYLKLFGKFFRYSVISQMQYRGNFLLMLPVHLTWTMEEIFVILILYGFTNNVYGWGKYEFILLLGTYFIVDSIFTSVLLPNIGDLSDKVRTGKLDFFMLKPIDSQFLVFTYRIDLGLVFAFIIGVVITTVSFVNLQIAFDPIKILIYLLLLVNGAISLASILFILSSFTFKTIKIDYVGSIFLTFAQFCKKPFDIYPRILRHIMMYAIPLGFVAYVPAGYLLNKPTHLWYLSFIFAPILLIISRKVWISMIKEYEGASS